MNATAPRPPKVPPAWFVHTAWRAHRALHRLSGGRRLWLNLQAHPEAVVRLAGQHPRPVRARPAAGEERNRLWQRWVAINPQLDAYAGLRSTDTPVVVLEPRPPPP
jgi:hypothetical protein